MISSVRIKDHWNEQRTFYARAFVATATIGVLAVLLALRLAWLQIVRHDYYVELSQGNRVRLDPIPASRGLSSTATASCWSTTSRPTSSS
jgi:penicillin-binding protein 2